MKKIRVLQVNKLYSPWIGGVETVTQDIAEGLNSEVDMNVLVCQPKGKGAVETVNGVKVTRAGSLGIYFSMPVSFSFIFKLRKMSKNADIIQLHDPNPLGDLALLLSGYKGKTAVWWHSDIVKQKKLLFFFKPIMNRFLKRVDRIIVATEGHITSSKYLGKYKEKCVVVPYGIKVDEYLNNPRLPVLTEKLTDSGSKKVLFTGRLIYYKGIEVLVRAFEEISGAELFIIGTGSEESGMRELVSEKNMSDKVHFLGNMPKDKLRAAFADCDFLVLPSVANSEAFGLVQLEAMVYGKPVINTNLPTGVPFVSVDGKTGITVPVNDIGALAAAIQKLTDDSALREEYGRNAAERVKQEFDVNKMAESVLSEYKKLLNISEDL